MYLMTSVRRELGVLVPWAASMCGRSTPCGSGFDHLQRWVQFGRQLPVHNPL